MLPTPPHTHPLQDKVTYDHVFGTTTRPLIPISWWCAMPSPGWNVSSQVKHIFVLTSGICLRHDDYGGEWHEENASYIYPLYCGDVQLLSPMGEDNVPSLIQYLPIMLAQCISYVSAPSSVLWNDIFSWSCQSYLPHSVHYNDTWIQCYV